MQNSGRMWKRSYLLIVFFISCVLFAQAQQKDTIGLQNAVNQLNAALVKKDVRSIKKIVSKRIQYAHSNGWIETRKEVIKHLNDGVLSYKFIKLDKVDATINKKIGVVKSRGTYTVLMGQKLLEFDLSVTQIWEWKKGKWILMSRQSVQLD
jgi:hypothetical protein